MEDGEDPALIPSDRRDLDELFSLTYEELRRLASTLTSRDPSATANPTALVNEAWLKLAGSPRLAALPQLHFKRIAARAMRQVLVDAARRRRADKRGGNVPPLCLEEDLHSRGDGPEEVIALDAALVELARLSPRQAAVVECRFFGGLGARESAELLGVSEATVLRDWRVARAWLSRELRPA